MVQSELQIAVVGCEEEAHSASTDQTDGPRVSWKASGGFFSAPGTADCGKGLYPGR